jgi:hypothetical protein
MKDLQLLGDDTFGHTLWKSDTNLIFDVLKKVINKRLNVVCAPRRRKSSEADGEEPDVKIGDKKPGLERRREFAG